VLCAAYPLSAIGEGTHGYLFLQKLPLRIAGNQVEDPAGDLVIA
jgi:hypothetical protein